MAGEIRSIPALLAACFTAVWSAGAAAQGAGCAPDAEIASALDNFQLAWSVAKGRVGTEASPETQGSPGSFWKRVTDETHDRADGLRSGSVGDNEHAYLTARVVGPATLRFWWKVDSEELGDYLTFGAVAENEAGMADGFSERTIFERSISGDLDWTEVVVPLPEEASYLARWGYLKDSSGHAGADAGWIDEVRVEGAGYGDIALNETKDIDADSVRLSWTTLPCRHYQVFWRPKDSDEQWRSMISKVEPATGIEGGTSERRARFREREYRVTLLAPPSFIRSPPSREFALTEGDSFSLVYEAEGSVPFRYWWYFRAAGADSPPRALAAEDGVAIDSDSVVGRSALKIAGLRERDEGEYFLIAENAAGRETAPGVSVEVLQPPGLASVQVKAGEHEPYRIEVGGAEDGLAAVRVNEGEGLVLNAEVTGSGPISGVWERRTDATMQWSRVSGIQALEEAVSTLRIDSASFDDAGQYRLILESRWGGPTLGPTVEVAVIVPPRARLAEESQPDQVLVGTSLTLSVEVTAGTPPFSFQWYRDGHVVSAEQGGGSATVTVATDHTGVYAYQAQVHNATGRPYQTQIREIEVAPFHGTIFRDCDECPEVVGINSGRFLMGTSLYGNDPGIVDERPQHEVTIPYRFAVGLHEVTFREWDACVSDGECRGYRPDDRGWGRGSRPVINVSWQDAKEFVLWLSQKTGMRYRLLSEAEWEYVARAGTRTPFHFGNEISTTLANYDGRYIYVKGFVYWNSRGQFRNKTTPVKSFSTNDFGLHDAHGNVREWVEDCYHANHKNAPGDGSPRTSKNCLHRVMRGGSWLSTPRHLRSAYRTGGFLDSRTADVGFRVARAVE